MELEGAVIDAPVDTGSMMEGGGDAENVSSGSDAQEAGTQEGVGSPDPEPEGRADELQAGPDQAQTEEGLAAAKLPKQYANDKYVKSIHFALHSLQQHYPGGANEAIKLKQEVEAFGGTEAFTDFQEQRSGWERIDKDFAEGNPAVLEDIAGESPDGFVKLMGPALDKLYTVNKEAYNHALGVRFWATLQQSGALNTLANLGESINRKDFDAAAKHLQSVDQFLGGINELAMNAPKQKAPDPEQEKFKQEKADYEKTKAKEFQESVLNSTRDYGLSRIDGQIAKELKVRGIDVAQMKASAGESYDILRRNCYQALIDALGTDQDGLARFQRAVNSGKREDALSLARQRIDTAYSVAVAKTIKAFYAVTGSKPQAQPQAVPRNGQAAKLAPGTTRLSKVPEAGTVDKLRMYAQYGKDKADSMIYNSRGYLKGKPGMYDWS